MKKSVKIRVFLFFLTATLSVCCSLGALIAIVDIMNMGNSIQLFNASLTSNIIFAVLAAIQGYSLLKLPTIERK